MTTKRHTSFINKCIHGFNPTFLNDLFTAQSNDISDILHRQFYVDFKNQAISFTVIHRIFCHMSIYVSHSNHELFTLHSLYYLKSECVTTFSPHTSLSIIYYIMVLAPDIYFLMVVSPVYICDLVFLMCVYFNNYYNTHTLTIHARSQIYAGFYGFMWDSTGMTPCQHWFR